MSASQSNLSSTGFDYVVAVTQDSINGTLEEYLYKSLPEVVLCYFYVPDKNNSMNFVPAPIEYATLVANAKNTDPFTVPDGTPGNDTRVQDLNNASFAFAIKAKLGLPPGVSPATLAPIVVLKPGQSNMTYTLMFSEFVATEIVFGPRGSVAWVNQSQPFGMSWTFSGAVDLNFKDAAFMDLPKGVQDRIKDLSDPNMFSVQQLYYDLNSSDLEQGFQFNNVPSNSTLNFFMTADFVNTYWKALKGKEVLGYGATQRSKTSPSSLAVTDLNFFTPDTIVTPEEIVIPGTLFTPGTTITVPTPGAAPHTLNYLCATNNNTLPDTTHAGFGWNWIEASEASQYDGVAALNRNTFAKYLNSVSSPQGGTLWEHVSSNCYLPWVHVTYDAAHAMTSFQWNMTSGQQPTVGYPSSGGTLLEYQYDSGTVSDEAGSQGALAKMELRSTFNMTLNVSDSTITIVQHLTVSLYVKRLLTSDGGDVVDKQITDTYTIGVDDHGKIAIALKQSVPVDNSQKPQADWFKNWFVDVQSLSNDVYNWAQSCVATKLTDVPISSVQNFIFPGGSTFSFADAAFSDYQDLVAHITYADPS